MYNSIRPGQVWLDTNGARIQAHGGSIFYENGTYYWYGENKERTDGRSDIWHWGVRLYSSKDLYNWKDEGLILQPSEDPNHPLHPTKSMDRPHIIYNKRTKKYVMWVKIMGQMEFLPIDPEGKGQDDVGRLAPDPGQGGELLHGAGHLAAEPAFDEAAGVHDVDSFGFEAAAFDIFMDCFRVGRGHGGRVGIIPEKGGSDLVDPLVGALGGKDGGHQRFIGVGEIELRPGAGVEAVQFVKDQPGVFVHARTALSRFFRYRQISSRTRV